MESFNFWDSDVWGFVNIVGVLLLSLLVANMLKKNIPFLKVSLIPTSVLGGGILLVISLIYTAITGNYIFDTPFFAESGSKYLEIITYHALALGFIATTFRPGREKMTKKRSREVFDTGVTTVSTYLIQGIVGILITALFSLFITGLASYAGILLPFGYGQGTGQALNYGNIYESSYGFVGGKDFGLVVAAFGFLSASIGGVIHLNIINRNNKSRVTGDEEAERLHGRDIQGEDEIPMNGSMDKLSVQLAFIFITYVVSYLIMLGLGKLLPGMRAVIYGFNFLFGVLVATAISAIVKALRKKGVIKKQYVNSFLMSRVGGFFFDIMVIAGIAVIRLDNIKRYWHVLLVLGIVGAVLTYFYVRFVCKRLFPDYVEEQFLVMYGMLTGTASSGMILLRERDKDLVSYAATNIVYQNIPAMVFGFPLMLIANYAPSHPYVTLGILTGFFILMNLILFRSKIFKRKKKDTVDKTDKTE
ncbi:MAG: hypothetical protein J6B34_03475 [Clostridia bacterium]|nr:hypothetical protein [Clostridia bacterium]